MTGQRSQVRLWWARIRQVLSVWEGREADSEGEGHRGLNHTEIIHHFLGHLFLTRSQNASFHQTYESAQIICDLNLWTASQVIADSSASLVRLIGPSESSPVLITWTDRWTSLVVFYKKWKTSAVSTTDMVETQFCKLLGRSDTFLARVYSIFNLWYGVCEVNLRYGC